MPPRSGAVVDTQPRRPIASRTLHGKRGTSMPLRDWLPPIIWHLCLGVPAYLLLGLAIARCNRRKGRCYNCARRAMPRYTELVFHSVTAPGRRLARGVRFTNVDPLDDEVTLVMPVLCDTVTIRQWPVPPKTPATAEAAITGESGA